MPLKIITAQMIFILCLAILAIASTSNAQAPSIVIRSPTDGETFDNTTIEVFVDVFNANLVNSGGEPNGNEGHFQVLMAGNSESGTQTHYIFTNLAPGQHIISAELLRNDNTEFDPPVIATAMITLAGATVSQPAAEQTTASGGGGEFLIIAMIGVILVVGVLIYMAISKRRKKSEEEPKDDEESRIERALEEARGQ